MSRPSARRGVAALALCVAASTGVGTPASAVPARPVAAAPTGLQRVLQLAREQRAGGYVGVLATKTVPAGTLPGRPDEIRLALAEDAVGSFVTIDTVHEGARVLGVLAAGEGDAVLTSWRLSGVAPGSAVVAQAETVVMGDIGDLFKEIAGDLACAALGAAIVTLTPLTGGAAFVAGSVVGTTVCFAMENIDGPPYNPYNVHWAGNSVDPYGQDSTYYEMTGIPPYRSLADFEVHAQQCLPQSAVNECLQPVGGSIQNVHKSYKVQLKWPDNSRQTIIYSCYCSYFSMDVDHYNYINADYYTLIVEVEEAVQLAGYVGIGRAERVYHYVYG